VDKSGKTTRNDKVKVVDARRSRMTQAERIFHHLCKKNLALREHIGYVPKYEEATEG
jgi:hypothetical protein